MQRRSSPDPTALEARLGYEFHDRSLLDAALTHPSALPPNVVRASEQLEFLGDAVVDLAIADLLLEALPECDEGQLSKQRALLARTSTLAAKAHELGVGDVLRLGRGEDRSGGRAKGSILAATYEAIIGAIFRDGGYAHARAVIARHFDAEITGRRLVGTQDWKTILQERTQARLRTVPEYRIAEEHGPAHARRFTSEVWVAGRRLACGQGPSKREAEQQAARVALGRLVEVETGE